LASHHENPEHSVEKSFVGVIGTEGHVTSERNPQKSCPDASNNGAQADKEANETIHVLKAIIEGLLLSECGDYEGKKMECLKIAS
jgi:hypothetical protein